ncbi:MAG: Uma2 family endonuclease [Sandaracinus sp.]
MLAETERRLFTVDEVLRMVDAGVLDEDEHVELLEGELVMVPPQGLEHTSRLVAMTMRLVPLYVGSALVRVQMPLHLDPHSMPEPDLAIVRSTPGRFPRGPDALVVMEVSWTSQRLDRHKAAIYARGGVPRYWWIDLEARRIVVHTAPEGDTYREQQVLGAGATITLPAIEVPLAVDELVQPGE